MGKDKSSTHERNAVLSRREFLKFAAGALTYEAYVLLHRSQSWLSLTQAPESNNSTVDLTTLFKKTELTQEEQQEYLLAFMQQCHPSLIRQFSVISIDSHEPYDYEDGIGITFRSDPLVNTDAAHNTLIDERPRRISNIGIRNEYLQLNNPIVRRLKQTNVRTTPNIDIESHDIPIPDPSLDTLIVSTVFLMGWYFRYIPPEHNNLVHQLKSD